MTPLSDFWIAMVLSFESFFRFGHLTIVRWFVVGIG